MALLNSFNSGVSAVKTFSKSLEVIGDNIANVNSTGFKGSRVTNQDSFSETLNRSAPANGDIPGANTMQIGQGTSVASVSQRFTQGVLSTTGGPADLGISGKGFFKVQDPENQNFYYTRAGDFRLDDTGNLLTNDGMNVMMGAAKVVISPTDPANPANPLQSYKIDKNGDISAYYANGTTSTRIGQILLTSFANPNALERVAGNLLTNPGGEAGGVGAAGATEATAANATLFGDIVQGTLELSNVDLTQQFSDLIVAQRAFQAGSRVITVSDSVMEEIVNLKR
jgi:flagellar hook protein FlgE